MKTLASIILILVVNAGYTQDLDFDSIDFEIVYTSDSLMGEPVFKDPCYLVSAKIIDQSGYDSFLRRKKKAIREINSSNSRKFIFVRLRVTKNGQLQDFRIEKSTLGKKGDKIALRAAKKLKFEPSYCKSNNESYDQMLIFPVKMFFE